MRLVLFILVACVLVPFTLASLAVWRAGGALRAERSAIDGLRSAISGLVIAPQEAPVRERIMEKIGTAPLQDTALAERVRLLDRAARAGVPASRDGLAILAEVSTERRLRLPRAVASLLVLVGLAATLLGLTTAVVSLGSMPATADGGSEAAATTATSATQPPGDGAAAVVTATRQRLNDVERSLRGTLAGMRTAFVPALLAVICTIILMIQLGLAHAEQRDVLAAMEALTDEYLFPVFNPSHEHLLQAGAAAAIEAAKQLLSSATEAADAVRGSTGLVGTAIQAASTDAARTLSRAVRRAVAKLEAAGDGIRTDSRDAATELLADARTAARELSRAAETDREPLRAAIADAIPVIVDLEQRTGHLVAVLQGAENAIGQVTSALDREAEVLGAVGGARQIVVQSLDRLVEQSRADAEARHELASSNGRLSAALSDLERVRSALTSIATGHGDWARGTLEVLKQQADLTQRMAETVADLRQSGVSPAAPSPSPEPVRTVPEFVRVEMVDPGLHFVELRDMVVAVIERQRELDDKRWERIFEQQERRWKEQNEAAAALGRAESALGRRERSRTPWWGRRTEADMSDSGDGTG